MKCKTCYYKNNTYQICENALSAMHNKVIDLEGECPMHLHVQDAYELGRMKNIAIENHNKAIDMVNHPPHYTDGNIEVIDFIEDKQLNFNIGNAVKYLSRAGKKEKDKYIQDLQKAIWYIDREIQRETK